MFVRVSVALWLMDMSIASLDVFSCQCILSVHGHVHYITLVLFVLVSRFDSWTCLLHQLEFFCVSVSSRLMDMFITSLDVCSC